MLDNRRKNRKLINELKG